MLWLLARNGIAKLKPQPRRLPEAFAPESGAASARRHMRAAFLGFELDPARRAPLPDPDPASHTG